MFHSKHGSRIAAVGLVAGLLAITLTVSPLTALSASAEASQEDGAIETLTPAPIPEPSDAASPPPTPSEPSRDTNSVESDETNSTQSSSHDVDGVVQAPITADTVAPFGEITLKIVGGSVATIASAPWQVGILDLGSSDYGSLFCGGSLITRSWIVTAAHCVDPSMTPYTRVLLGKNKLSTSSYSGVPISEIIVHPLWNEETNENDIALIRLTNPATLVPNVVQTIGLSTQKPIGGTAAQITGWGKTSYYSSQISADLRIATVYVGSDTFCRSDVGSAYDPTTMLCASTDMWMQDTCQGDSGGPLTTVESGSRVLSGITSWGYGCAGFSAGVYTNVSNYLNWIAVSTSVTAADLAISGSSPPRVGTTLTAVTGNWAPAGLSYTYQWRADADPVGTNSASYTPTLADLGKRLTVSVTASRTGYLSATKVSADTEPVSPGQFNRTPTPTISGTNAVGQLLTAVPGSWDSGVALSYQWFRGEDAIIGATTVAYQLTGADFGQLISVRVTGKKLGFDPVTISSLQTTSVSGGPFVALGTPTMVGTRAVGKTLTATTGTWNPVPEFSYQWFRGATAIAGATESSYTLTSADLNALISVRVTGTATGYATTTRPSAPTTAITAGTLATTPVPALEGTTAVGNRLSAVPGTWDDGVTWSYQWLRGTTVITGATGANYTLVAADLSQRISVKVTGRKTGYTSVTKTSLASAAVTRGTLSLTPTPTVAGTAKVGQRLTAVPGSWDTGVALSYQWLRDGTAISGATTTSYLLTPSDLNKSVTVRVTGRKAGYTDKAVTNESVAFVEAGTLLLTPTPTIGGTVNVGQVLTARSGTWDSGASFSYQWSRDGTVIAGAIGASYKLTVADYATRISVAVTAAKVGFENVTRQSAPLAPTGLGTLTAIGAPTISGSAVVGRALNAVAGNWETGASLTYQWRRGGIDIYGAQNPRYQLVGDDAGKQISVRVTATKEGYASVSRTSNATSVVTVPIAIPADGTYRVGVNLQPGTYVTTGQTQWCYWKRIRDFSGTFSAIIDNNLGNGKRIMTILPSDVGLVTDDCGSWQRLDQTATSQKETIPGDGIYSVEKHVVPGTYQSSASAGAGCYWARLEGFTSSGSTDIIANSFSYAARPIVTISPTDLGFESDGCGSWTRLF